MHTHRHLDPAAFAPSSLRLLARSVSLALAAAPLFCAPSAAAQEQPWAVRGGIAYAKPFASSDAADGLRADAVSAGGQWTPELSASRFLTPNVAIELSASFPARHGLTIDAPGLGGVGRFDAQRTTLLVQWHFLDLGAYKPYAGIGVDYTRFGNGNLSGGGRSLQVDGHSSGIALQVGVDYRFGRHWFVNADAKRVFQQVDVRDGGARLTTLRLDPYVLSLGIGYRF